MYQQASNSQQNSARLALDKSRAALMRGEKAQSFYWASIAVHQDPSLEEAHLILAAVTPPRDSIYHLNKALAINPASKRAQAGLRWAEERLQAAEGKGESQPSAKPKKLAATSRKAGKIQKWAGTLLGILLTVAIIGLSAMLIFYLLSGKSLQTPRIEQRNYAARPVNALVKSNITPEVMIENTITQTDLPTSTTAPTGTAVPTATPMPTATSEPTQTPLPLPSETPIQVQITPVVMMEEQSPPAISDDRWIDVNLSTQKVFAYEGSSLVNSFIASTGTWEHPTVTGQYQIYIKYRYADMRGPGYYLTDVPYVMYFYKGYGLHGTYWHNNFGTPMSHGCINLITEDAGWLFNWASVGTVVNIHY